MILLILLSCVLGLSLNQKGEFLFVAAAEDGLKVYSVPEDTLVGEWNLDHWGFYPEDVKVDYRRAFVADGTDGVHTLDVSDPSSPVLLHTTCLEDCYVSGMDLWRHHLFVSMGTRGIGVFGIAYPDSLYPIGVWDLCMSWDIEIINGIGYSVGGPSGVHVIDLRDPQDLCPLDTLPIWDLTLGISSCCDTLYLLTSSSSILKVNRNSGAVFDTLRTQEFHWDAEVSPEGTLILR